MVRFILIVTLLLTYNLTYAQPDIGVCLPPDQILDIPISLSNTEPKADKSISESVRKRSRNLDFYTTMRYLQPPSTVAAITSFPINTLGYTKKNYVLDANIQFPIAIGGKRMGLSTFQLIPQFKVRIFQDDEQFPYGPNGDVSMPVRTPSNLPGLAYYWSFDNWWKPGRQMNRFSQKPDKQEIKESTSIGKNYYMGVYIFHHSNGQDGVEIDDVYARDSVNLYNGNYAEQVVFEAIFGVQRRWKMKTTAFDTLNKRKVNKKTFYNIKDGKSLFIKVEDLRELNWRFGLEIHPKQLSNPEFRQINKWSQLPLDDNAHILGRYRFNGRVSFHLTPKLIEYVGSKSTNKWCMVNPAKYYERWRFMIEWSLILDNNYYRGPNVNRLDRVGTLGLNRRLNLEGSAYHVFKRSKYLAAFASAGYLGSDRYNIYFNQSLWQLKVGIAFGFFNQAEGPDYYN